MGKCKNCNCESKHGNNEYANLYHWYGSPVKPNIIVAIVVLVFVIVAGLLMTTVG